jgi:hypothetical protein
VLKLLAAASVQIHVRHLIGDNETAKSDVVQQSTRGHCAPNQGEILELVGVAAIDIVLSTPPPPAEGPTPIRSTPRNKVKADSDEKFDPPDNAAANQPLPRSEQSSN